MASAAERQAAVPVGTPAPDVVLAFYVKAFNAEIVGVSAEPPARNLAWTRQLGLPFRLLSDPDGRLARVYGVWDDTWNLPRRVTFVIDRAGSLAIDTSRTLDAVRKLARPK